MDQEEAAAAIRALIVHVLGQQAARMTIIIRITDRPDLMHQHTSSANSRGYFTDGTWVSLSKPIAVRGAESKGRRLHPKDATFFMQVRRDDREVIRIYIEALPDYNEALLAIALRSLR